MVAGQDADRCRDMNGVLPLLLVVDRRSKRREKHRVGRMPAGGGRIPEIVFVLILHTSYDAF